MKKLTLTRAKLKPGEKTLGASLTFQDSSPSVSLGSRAEKYWLENDFRAFYRQLRPGITLPRNMVGQNIIQKTIDTYHLKGIGFGNWVTIEDRYNYVNALYVALYDMRKVTGFGNNIGLNALTVTFGARGKGKALAHYEPWSDYINLTRYREGYGDGNKPDVFLASGGIASFAHEYGHFLDYFAGKFFDKNGSDVSLSGGRSLAKDRANPNAPEGSLRDLMDRQIEMLMWDDSGKKQTGYYRKLVDEVVRNPKLGDYWLRRNELFARYFEVFTQYKLGRAGVSNKLLSGQKKYETKYKVFYPQTALVAKIAPITENFLKVFNRNMTLYGL